MQGNCSQTAVLGGEVKAGVQVCLAEGRTLGVSVYTSLSAHTMESFCLSWGMPCVSAPRRVCGQCSAGCCWKCLCICVYVYACACVRLLPQPCWCLHKETWQKDNSIRWEQSTGEGVIQMRQLVLEKAWKKKSVGGISG